jgi:hypothetical protein
MTATGQPRQATCCGQRTPGVAGAALVNACQLCPHSPTYWRGPDHQQPAPPPAVPATVEPAVVTPTAMPSAPARPAVRPGVCVMCGASARLYPGGSRCDNHLPTSTAAIVRRPATPKE